MEDNQKIEELILKQLQQEATPAESAQLEKWLQSDPQNREQYRILARIWEDSLKVLGSRHFDTLAAWDKMRLRIAGTPDSADTGTAYTATDGTRVFSLTKRWLVAASTLLIIAVGGWYFYRQSAQSPSQTVLGESAHQRTALPDGSIVYLQKGASLKYAKNYGSRDRQVELSGEAYFEVIHDPAIPFRVKTSVALIEDIGTAFLVREKDTAAEVIVISGRVRLADKDQQSRNILLGAGEKATLTTHSISQDKQADSNFIAWKTGILDFRHTELARAFRDIGDFYGITVIPDPALQQQIDTMRITAHFEHQPVKEVFTEIKLFTGLEMRQEKDTFVFYRR